MRKTTALCLALLCVISSASASESLDLLRATQALLNQKFSEYEDACTIERKRAIQATITLIEQMDLDSDADTIPGASFLRTFSLFGNQLDSYLRAQHGDTDAAQRFTFAYRGALLATDPPEAIERESLAGMMIPLAEALLEDNPGGVNARSNELFNFIAIQRQRFTPSTAHVMVEATPLAARLGNLYDAAARASTVGPSQGSAFPY